MSGSRKEEADPHQKSGQAASHDGSDLGIVPQRSRDKNPVRSSTALIKQGTSPYKAEEVGFFLLLLLLWFRITNE